MKLVDVEEIKKEEPIVLQTIKEARILFVPKSRLNTPTSALVGESVDFIRVYATYAEWLGSEAFKMFMPMVKSGGSVIYDLSGTESDTYALHTKMFDGYFQETCSASKETSLHHKELKRYTNWLRGEYGLHVPALGGDSTMEIVDRYLDKLNKSVGADEEESE